MTKVEVSVQLKKAVLDPEARAVLEAIRSASFKKIKDLKIAKTYTLELELGENEALEVAGQIAKEFLANPVSQTFDLKKV